jgi:hypothetical protein
MESRLPKIKVTVYTRRVNSDGGYVEIIRRVLSNCRAENSAGVILRNTGQMPQNTRFIYVFNDPVYEYLPYEEWLITPDSELDKYWSADFLTSQSTPRMPSLVVDRETDCEFEGIDGDGRYPIVGQTATAAGTSPTATNAENDVIGTINGGRNAMPGLARLKAPPEDKRRTLTARAQFVLLNSNPISL